MRATPLRAAAATVALGLGIASIVALEPLSSGLVGAAGCLLLVAVTVTDLERRIVPNRIVLPGIVAALVARTALDPSVRWLLAAVGVAGILLVLALVYPAGLGMGDVKLTAFLGAWLGWNALVALVLGSFAGFVPAAALLVRHGRAARKRGIPFAPFLALGGVVALFAAGPLVDWYRSLGS